MAGLLPVPRRFTRVAAMVLGVPFLVGLAYLTLAPSRVEKQMPVLLDLVLSTLRDLGWQSLGFNTLEVLANILVFVPVGILAFLLLPRRAWWLAFFVGPLLSITIELVQLLALPARAATVSDILANSAGATIGVGLAVLCTLLSRSPHRPSPSLEPS